MGRWMGIDYGERRFGLALSDPTGLIASPAGALTRRSGKRPPWRQIEDFVQVNQVEGVVLGLPLALSGSETDWTREVRKFGEQLATRLKLPVELVDERMTSVQAERTVRGSGLGRSAREEKERIDETAAALILQQYLDRERKRPPG